MRKTLFSIPILLLFTPSISHGAPDWISHGAPELTLDFSTYEYEEKAGGAFYMSDESKPLFFSFGIRDWERPLIDTQKLLYTAELTLGRVNYKSASTGTMNKIYYKARFESLYSHNINGYAPFVGLGYRVLFDDSDERVSSTGHKGYGRRSQYVYLPLGIMANLGDKLSFKGQYNLFIRGKQTSYLSDVVGCSDDLDNTQKDGYGFDTALNYKLREDLSIVGYYRYWDVEDSLRSSAACAGSVFVEGIEPENTTREMGIGIAFAF